MAINWTSMLDEARDQAEREGKLMLVDLFNPSWKGSLRMNAETYSDPSVQEDIAAQFVPVQFNIIEQPSNMVRFCAAWTPTILIQDCEGHEYRRCEGYFAPRRFRSELALGIFKAAFDQLDFRAAHECMRTALTRCADDPLEEPEALYWAAISEYKVTQDIQKLAEGWRALIARYPESSWAKRAEA